MCGIDGTEWFIGERNFGEAYLMQVRARKLSEMGIGGMALDVMVFCLYHRMVLLKKGESGKES